MNALPVLNEPFLEERLAYVLALGPSDFAPIAHLPELFDRTLRESQSALEHVLTSEAHPFRQKPPIAPAAHAALPGGLDLLRYAFRTERLMLEITDGTNLSIVRASFADAPFEAAPDRREYVRALLGAAVRLVTQNHGWIVDLPDGFGTRDGPRHASNRYAPAIGKLVSRHDRIDVITLDDVYFVFYKKIDQLMTFLPDDRWFPAEARRALLG